MIKKEEYQFRRKQLAAQLPEGAVAIIPGGSEVLRNGDTHYRFRQDSNFYYLTGFNEPDALLYILAGERGESYFFNRPRHPALEQWTGRRLGQEEALDALGMDAAYSIDDFDAKLPDLLSDKAAIYYPMGRHLLYEKKMFRALERVKAKIRRGVQSPESIHDIEPLLSEMRLHKSQAEIAIMRKAATISVDAHMRAMKACRDAENEHELEAELLYEFSRKGCRSTAYDSIVGAGQNACILHYNDNNQPLNKGDLVLIDAGGEYQHYAADITRTFPINGTFSPEQRAIYELVLNAQTHAIAAIKPGLPWNEIQRIIVETLTAGLCELGLLNGSVNDLIANEAYKPFYMHNSGHWLGLDVHDVGRYKIHGEWRFLEPGMVITVEPGLYISEGLKGVDKRWWNIGVRIEDDILITADGYDNLTAALPSRVADIEALLRD